jgi:hypothetical protein
MKQSCRASIESDRKPISPKHLIWLTALQYGRYAGFADGRFRSIVINHVSNIENAGAPIPASVPFRMQARWQKIFCGALS